MSGLDDLIKAAREGTSGQSGGGGGGGLADILGGVLGGRSGGGLGGALGGGRAGGGLGGGLLGALLPVVASLLANGGLKKILSGMQGRGLSSQADSWVGAGENEPIQGSQVREVLGDEEVARISQQLGVPEDEAAEAVAQVLPTVVDRVSPAGQLPEDDELESAFARLRDLSD